MKTLRILLAALAVGMLSAEARAQETSCITPPPTTDHLEGIDVNAFKTMDINYTVQLFIHIVNQSDGTGGADWADVLTELEVVKADFAPHDICLVVVGADEINSDFLASGTAASRQQLIQTNAHGDEAIDAYILPASAGHGGNAYSIPSGRFTMGAQRFGARTFSHELGHCLGLYHTHETAFGNEWVNGWNCGSAGDKLCDTPADPDLSDLVNTSCNYTGTATDFWGNTYNPDETQIMAYTRTACRANFSPDAEARMHATLNSASALQDVTAFTSDVALFGGFFGTPTVYNSGDLFLTSTTQVEAGVVTIGSTTTQPLTLQGSTQTVLHGNDRVLLVPGLTVQPNSAGLFQARVGACDTDFTPGFVPPAAPPPADEAPAPEPPTEDPPAESSANAHSNTPEE